MKYLTMIPKTSRRAAAVIAAAGLIAVSAASAAGSSGVVLAADTSHAAPAAVRTCTAEDLGAWVAVSQSNGAAGSIYYPLQFTNLSQHACAMRGFPGVSAVDRHGHQLGRPASRDHVIPSRTVVLAPGATAHTILRYGDVTVATSPGCHPTFSTFELRIYPPGQRRATYAAFDLEACSHAGPVYLGVEPLQPGAGTVSG
jgi:Tfp pilus assembly protein PilW